MSRLTIRAVIFDMDGLVLDSETGYFAAWQLAADKMGYELNQAFCHSLSGAYGSMVSQMLRQYFGNGFDIQQFYDLSGRFWRESVQQHGIPVKAGFFVLLQRIRALELPYCLATNSRRQDALRSLQWAGLADIFPIIITLDEVNQAKPAPDLFIKAALELKLPSESCLVLEDSTVGVSAAVAANCPCVWVPSLPDWDRQQAVQANRVLSDLEQVADFLSAQFDHSI